MCATFVSCWFHVCCFGWGGYVREEREAIKERGLEEFFHFLPATDEVAKAIRGVDFVAMPSKWEACPLLAMEVLAAGTPLISSDCIGLSEVTRDQPVLTFPVGDFEELVRQIRYFSENRQNIEMKVAQNRQAAAKLFDVKTTALELRTLLAR